MNQPLHHPTRVVNRGDRLFRGILRLFGLVVLAIALLILVELWEVARPSVERFGLRFLIETQWDPVREQFGALPFVYGTLVSSLIAILLAVPLGLGVAFFLSEMAPRWLREPVSFLVELLAAIPSVVYGLWGLFVLVPIIRSLELAILRTGLSRVPLFSGAPYGIGMLSAGVVLAIMIVPTVAAVSREVFRAVPDSQREAALALGATRWEAMKVVFDYGRPGIVGAVVLAWGRALGETMAVNMVIGNQPIISASLFSPAHTMASVIASEFNEAVEPMHVAALAEIGLALLGLTLLLSALARLLVLRVERRSRGRQAAQGVTSP
ncbi:phosphate ABC transporter permease subunit PstC [Limnochorda sp.]|uniref:phosphate ABC transporter permease subunit PstC n=1 Tax=Limnochorda sp. TaxID=1940279 RepID=UPI001D52E851|nr:phosphate ABC transporter permease subunit PstC [Bacillota bacterium]MBO2519324.1 phosphate ABC transporter permease subunit PstC [Bacillota bacterium]